MRYVRFRPDEFLTGVNVLSSGAVIGCYWMICSLIYSKGEPVDDDPEWLAKVCKVHGLTWLAARRELLAKGKLFEVVHMGRLCLMNARAEMELGLSFHRSEVGRTNADARHRRNRKPGGNGEETGRKRRGNGVEQPGLFNQNNNLGERSAMLTNQRSNESTKNGTHAPGKPEGASRARAMKPDDWSVRLNGYKPGDHWPDDWGPRPESGKCDAPDFAMKKWRVDQGLPP